MADKLKKAKDINAYEIKSNSSSMSNNSSSTNTPIKDYGAEFDEMVKKRSGDLASLRQDSDHLARARQYYIDTKGASFVDAFWDTMEKKKKRFTLKLNLDPSNLAKSVNNWYKKATKK